MKIYYYCSYDGSPVGFRIGTADYPSQEEDLIELSDIQINPFIRRCFETGFVRSAFGKIPDDKNLEENKYFLLQKKLSGKKNDCNYYMNIAIVCEWWDEFIQIMKNADNKDNINELVSALLNSIEPAKTNSFGYYLNSRKLSDVVSIPYGEIFKCTNNKIKYVKEKSAFVMTLSTSTPDINILKSNLGLSKSIDKGLTEFKRKSDKVFCYEKKTIVNKGNQLIPLLTMIVMICTIIAILITMIKR